MDKYIFLDNWVLAEYTKDDKIEFLSNYINNNNLKLLINSFSFVELYNPIINENDPKDRVSRVCKFLSSHPGIIVDPVDIYRLELFSYPNEIKDIPFRLNLEAVNKNHRYTALINFFKRDNQYIKMGKDINSWVKSYTNLKENWLKDVDKIIKDAIKKGILKNENEKLFNIQSCKHEFLQYLNRRYFSYLSSEERSNLGEKIIPLFMNDMNKLKSIHFTSLCFWYKYIDIDKSYTMNKNNSDIGDFYQMSLIPYCTVFTLDKTMRYLSVKINQETKFTCKLLNKKQLDNELGLTK